MIDGLLLANGLGSALTPRAGRHPLTRCASDCPNTQQQVSPQSAVMFCRLPTGSCCQQAIAASSPDSNARAPSEDGTRTTSPKIVHSERVQEFGEERSTHLVILSVCYWVLVGR